MNEDCLNISVDNVHQMNNNLGGGGMGEPNFFGDKESSIHMDGTRNEMDGFLNDMSESSISMNPFPIIPHSSNGPKSKMSMSQTSSARKGTKGKKGGPASVAEGSIKSSAKGTKKKKKSS